MSDLYKSISEYDESLAKEVKEYSGIIGLPTSNKTVYVPNRNSYVYVRLRDNQSEVIQAFNETVSPVWGLPVIIIRRGNTWYIKGRDIERYNNWGSNSSFVPEHAAQHEFDPDNPGGDIVFVYPQQFVPLLVTPSGTDGGPNVIMQQYNYKKSNGTWLFAGITGTQSLIIHRPVDDAARIGLVYFDKTSGNPGFLINSGSSVAASTTGTQALLQYLPSVSNDYEPLAMVRMVSGTTTIDWDNLYDVRQFFGGTVTGTSGGGGISEAPIDGLVYGRKDAGWTQVSGSAGGSPAGVDTNVQFNQSSAFGATYKFAYDYGNNVLVITSSGTPPAFGSNELHLLAAGSSPGIVMWAASNNSSINPYFKANRYRGTFQAPLKIEAFDEIFQLRGAGYDGTTLSPTQVEILFDTPYDWSPTSYPTEISMWVTPSGSTSMEHVASFRDYGVNLSTGKTYNINGSPHTHDNATSGQWYPSLTNTSNIDSSVAHSGTWQRIDNIVSFAGVVEVDATSAAAVIMKMSLPIASNFNSTEDASGNITRPGTAGSIIPDTSTNELDFRFNAPDTANGFYRFAGQYVVK